MFRAPGRAAGRRDGGREIDAVVDRLVGAGVAAGIDVDRQAELLTGDDRAATTAAATAPAPAAARPVILGHCYARDVDAAAVGLVLGCHEGEDRIGRDGETDDRLDVHESKRLATMDNHDAAEFLILMTVDGPGAVIVDLDGVRG